MPYRIVFTTVHAPHSAMVADRISLHALGTWPTYNAARSALARTVRREYREPRGYYDVSYADGVYEVRRHAFGLDGPTARCWVEAYNEDPAFGVEDWKPYVEPDAE